MSVASFIHLRHFSSYVLGKETLLFKQISRNQRFRRGFIEFESCQTLQQLAKRIVRLLSTRTSIVIDYILLTTNQRR
jgi:hypothetical protein